MREALPLSPSGTEDGVSVAEELERSAEPILLGWADLPYEADTIRLRGSRLRATDVHNLAGGLDLIPDLPDQVRGAVESLEADGIELHYLIRAMNADRPGHRPEDATPSWVCYLGFQRTREYFRSGALYSLAFFNDSPTPTLD